MRLAEALERQEGAARATLEAAGGALGDGASIEQQVIVGPDPASVIVYAVSGKADLLVLGSRAYGPVRRALLGSVFHGGHPPRPLPGARHASGRQGGVPALASEPHTTELRGVGGRRVGCEPR